MSTILRLPIEKYTFTELTDDQAKVRINVMHEKQNPNGTYFEKSSLYDSMDSFVNKPIVCAYQYDSNGNITDFKEHNDEEAPIGVIPESNNYSVENIDDLDWACVDGIIFKEYCPEAYVMLKNGKNISMEIEVLEGFKGDDGFYHINKFNLLAVTVLGDKYEPAMGNNATIELFTKNSDKFIAKFSNILYKANKIVKERNDIEVNRDEIIKKFSLLNKDTEEYKSIVDDENLSNEELEKKLYSLSISQISMAINESLSTEKIIKTYWDGEKYETLKYCLEDVIDSDSLAIVYSHEDYKYYGIPYSMNGDKATLDYKKCKRYVVGDWRPYSEGEEELPNPIETFSKEIIEQANKQIEKIKNEYSSKENENIPDVKETEEYKKLDEELKSVKAKYTTLQSDKTALDDEVKELREFKSNVEKAEKEAEINEVIEQYSVLKDIEGYDKVIENKYDISKEELEKNLKVFAYDNDITINKKRKFTTTKKATQLPIDNGEESKHIPSAWDILD